MKCYASLAFVVVALLSVAPASAQIPSGPVTTPPTIDGAVGATEWAGAGTLALPHGTAYFLNDQTYLYVLLDVTADTTLDPLVPGVYNDDNFGIAFDANGNGSGDIDIDVNYGAFDNPPAFPRISYFADPAFCGWTGGGATSSLGAEGFGMSPAAPATNHVIWEFALLLSEISPPSTGRIGTAVWLLSVNPSFNDLTPAADLCDWANYADLQLNGFDTAVPVAGAVGLAILVALVAIVGVFVARSRLG